MRAHRRLVGHTTVALLLILLAAACATSGPTDYGDIRVAIDSATDATVDVTSSGPGMSSSAGSSLALVGSSEVIVPLASTWEVKVDGRHIIGSGDRPDLALPSPGQRQDLKIHIQVAPDGTVMLLDVQYVAPERQPGPSA